MILKRKAEEVGHRPPAMPVLILAACVVLAAGCGGGEQVRDSAAFGDHGEDALSFNAPKAMEHIRYLSEEIGPRIGGSDAEHQAAAYIREAFAEMGYGDVVQQPFDCDPEHTGYNVFVEDVGEKPEWVVVVGAHYDTAGGTGSPGANDNASGVAVMLELARVFQREENLPTLLFAAFSSEEYSEQYYEEDTLSGSEYLASYLEETRGAAGERRKGREVIGMVNLDMVGVGETAVAFATLEAPGTLSELFIGYAERQEVPVEFEQDPGGWSDNESFEAVGISSFTLEWQLDTTYHTPQDTYWHIDSDLIEESGRLLEGFLAGLKKLAIFTLRRKVVE